MNTSQSVKEITSRFFISQYAALFNETLAKLDNTSKHFIRNNKQLNDMYDLFLDFIIDSNQHLEYTYIKQQTKEIEDVGPN